MEAATTESRALVRRRPAERSRRALRRAAGSRILPGLAAALVIGALGLQTADTSRPRGGPSPSSFSPGAGLSRAPGTGHPPPCARDPRLARLLLTLDPRVLDLGIARRSDPGSGSRGDLPTRRAHARARPPPGRHAGSSSGCGRESRPSAVRPCDAAVPRAPRRLRPIAGYRLSEPVGYWNALGLWLPSALLLAFGLVASRRTCWCGFPRRRPPSRSRSPATSRSAAARGSPWPQASSSRSCSIRADCSWR